MGGCFGPTAIRQTRDRYNEAIRQTNDEELLLNLVRLRYNEHPSFLPVTGLNSQFELSAGADAGGAWIGAAGAATATGTRRVRRSADPHFRARSDRPS